MRPDLINPLVLAYLGDSVFELLVREYLVLESGLVKPNDLQKQAVKYVSAKSHNDFMQLAMQEGFLSDEEVGIYKRGRNTKGGKNETIDHHSSTGFEAIIGTLYIQGDKKRINEIFERYQKFVEEDNLR